MSETGNEFESDDDDVSEELVTQGDLAASEINSKANKAMSDYDALKKDKARGKEWAPPEALAAYGVLFLVEQGKQMTIPQQHAECNKLFKAQANVLVTKKLWTPGKNGHPTVQASVDERTKKSKGTIYRKAKDLKTQVTSRILKEFYKLFPACKLPSGVMPAQAMEDTKRAYYKAKLTATQKSKFGEDMADTWTNGPWMVFEAHGPLSDDVHPGLCIRIIETAPGVDTSRGGQRQLGKSQGTLKS